MKHELKNLLSLTELYIYENYSVKKSAPKPVITAKSKELPPIALPEKKAIEPVPIQKEVVLKEIEKPSLKPVKDFTDIEKIFETELPHIKLLKKMPDDSEAKRKAEEWKFSDDKALFYIFTGEGTEKELVFLQNLAKSITIYFGKACVLPINELHETHLHPNLKCCFASRSISHSLLQKNFPPICFFDTIADYFANPLSKATLWKAIVDRLKA